MFKKKTHGLALAYKTSVGFLALCTYLMGSFFALTHVGQGLILWTRTN